MFCSRFPSRYLHCAEDWGYSMVWLLSLSLEVNFLKDGLVAHLRHFKLHSQKPGHIKGVFSVLKAFPSIFAQAVYTD